MKNVRAVWMLSISIILGFAVTAMAVGWVSQKGAIASSKVVVAITDIEMGSRLTPQMLSAVDWPTGSLPEGAFSDLNILQDRVVRTSIQRGEAVLNVKLAPLGAQGGLSAVITEGKRAMTVRVNDVVGATSGTRREDKLFRPDQLEHVHMLRRGLGQMPPQSAMEWLTKRIANTTNNDALLDGL